MRILNIICLFVCSALFFVIVSFSAHAQGLFENGSFETGSFTGWTVLNEGSGDWFVYSGTTLPISINSFLPPPVGVFAAATDQTGGGSHILYQDVFVPVGAEVLCTAIIYYRNLAQDFFIGPDLSYLSGPNQQARIDIISTDADPFTVSAGVLLNIFQTLPGDPLSLGYTPIDFDLTQFAGSAVRFRVAEVDNVFFLNFAIDDVTCREISRVSPIPTLGEWGMIAMAGVLGIAGLLYARRRRMTANA